MKILHLLYTQGISGAEKYLKHLLPGLEAYGIYCDLIIVCPKSKVTILQDYYKELNALGITTTIIASNRLSFIYTAKKISNYLKSNSINIVHSHLVNSDVIASFIKSFFIPKLFLVSTKHGYQEKILQDYDPGKKITPPNNLYYYITQYTLRKIDRNITVSKGMADFFYNIKLTDTHYPFIHHGIKIESFNPKDYLKECRKAEQQLIIVGRIEPYKGYNFLIAALPFVAKVYPHFKLLVLGEGSEKINCIDKINQLGLSSNVEFLGFQPHPYSYISNSDVIILPSVFEPFGLVFIEAFALKTPIVAFDTPAGNEIMEHEKTGLLVNKGNIKALAEKIIYLLDNKAQRENIAGNAFEKYKERFTTATMINNTVNWYKENLS